MKIKKGILKEHSSILRWVMHAFDWFVIALSGLLAEAMYIGTAAHSPDYMNVILMSVLIAGMIFPRFGLYRAWRGSSIFDELTLVGVAWISVMAVLAVAAFLTKTGSDFSRGWGLVWLLTGLALLLIERSILRCSLRLIRTLGYNQRRIAIVGSSRLTSGLAGRIEANEWLGLKIAGVFNLDSSGGSPFGNSMSEEAGGMRESTNKCLKKYQILPFEKFDAFMDEGDSVDQVWISLPFKDEDVLRQILHALRHSTVDIKFVPDIFGLRLLNHSISEVAGLPVINLSSTPMEGGNIWIKHLEDVILASIILIMISPLMFFLAIGVKLSSPGPVFYRQERVGWNNKRFLMLKFRSMPVDAESKTGPIWAKPGENRATRFGNFIRKTSLDELPQFINVLKGDMSIVGPRPERPVFVEKFKEEIPDYMKKHMVKAGITGWAQVNGWRGSTDLKKRIEYDLYYIENWSLWFDLKIIFLTIFKGFVNRNAY